MESKVCRDRNAALVAIAFATIWHILFGIPRRCGVGVLSTLPWARLQSSPESPPGVNIFDAPFAQE